jgi:broad specificity phosphatase PhoE
MNIYLVRHGETEWNKEEIFRGRKDVPLNERGLRQAELTGRYFGGVAIDRICSSPLSRAVQTAKGIAAATMIPVIGADAFTDIAFGTWEGLTLDEVGQRFPAELEAWQSHPHKFRMRGVESLTHVRKRAAAGLKAAMEGAGSVVIVTHRVICKVLVLHLLGMPNRCFWRIKCDPASITRFETVGEEPVLHFMNETCHLKENGADRYGDF